MSFPTITPSSNMDRAAECYKGAMELLHTALTNVTQDLSLIQIEGEALLESHRGAKETFENLKLQLQGYEDSLRHACKLENVYGIPGSTHVNQVHHDAPGRLIRARQDISDLRQEASEKVARAWADLQLIEERLRQMDFRYQELNKQRWWLESWINMTLHAPYSFPFISDSSFAGKGKRMI